MQSYKEEIVKKIILTPIICDKKYKAISLDDGIIRTPQTYCGEADCDMSDFAIKFYEIIYSDIIPNENKKILLDKGKLASKEFAGDTINSFNALANIILGDKNKNSRSPKSIWPELLIRYERDYHCLANFWLIPMRHGRTSAKLNHYDSLDCYLMQLKVDYNLFKSDEQITYPHDNNYYTNYFRIVESYDQFVEIHGINNYLVKNNPKTPYENKT